MVSIVLNFIEHGSRPALESVRFNHPLLSETRVSYRGKGLSTYLCQFTFQWSPAVRAISILLLRTKAGDCHRSSWPTLPLAALSGAAGTCAASLDYALSKQPLWMSDMFGITSAGETLARGLFTRWNPERKRGGEVIVAVNPQQLPADGIEITLNGTPLEPAGCIRLADAIEESEASAPSLTNVLVNV